MIAFFVANDKSGWHKSKKGEKGLGRQKTETNRNARSIGYLIAGMKSLILFGEKHWTKQVTAVATRSLGTNDPTL